MNTSWSIGLNRIFPVGFDGDAPVIVQGYGKYPDKAFCVSRV